MGIIDHGVYLTMRLNPWSSIFKRQAPRHMSGNRRSNAVSDSNDEARHRSRKDRHRRVSRVPSSILLRLKTMFLGMLRRGALTVFVFVLASGVCLWVASARTGIPVSQIARTLVGLPVKMGYDITDGLEKTGETLNESLLKEELPGENPSGESPATSPDNDATSHSTSGTDPGITGPDTWVSDMDGSAETDAGNRDGVTKNDGTGYSSQNGQDDGNLESAGSTVQYPTDLIRPVDGEIVTSFGWVFSETYKDWRFHPGLDFSANAGEVVKAVCPGTILAVEEDPIRGLVITKQYGSTDITISYAGCAEPEVRVGQTVKAKDPLAVIGQTGLWETHLGAHLHFEMRRAKEAVDPVAFFER
jgi:murein DD-endopeptidase MepM/ murein hydrolase activator NlpD